jgi:hypothetical protein
MTSIDNLAHLCPAHHQLKHRSEWQVSQQGGGVLRWRAPSGLTYDTHPEGGPAPPSIALSSTAPPSIALSSTAPPSIALSSTAPPSRTLAAAH